MHIICIIVYYITQGASQHVYMYLTYIEDIQGGRSTITAAFSNVAYSDHLEYCATHSMLCSYIPQLVV